MIENLCYEVIYVELVLLPMDLFSIIINIKAYLFIISFEYLHESS